MNISVNPARYFFSVAMLSFICFLSACGQSNSDGKPVQEVASQAGVEELETDNNTKVSQSSSHPDTISGATTLKSIIVSGELTFQSASGLVKLMPLADSNPFKIDISAIGTIYRFALVDNESPYKTQWQLELAKTPVFGDQKWTAKLSSQGSDELSCGGMAFTSDSKFFTCTGIQIDLVNDRDLLKLGFTNTSLVTSLGTINGLSTHLNGALKVEFPSSLAIASLDDYPSRSSGFMQIEGEAQDITSIIPHPSQANTSAKLEVLLGGTAMTSGLEISSNFVSVNLLDQVNAGQSIEYKCGRRLTEAEYECLEEPITMGPQCDKSFLTEASLCKSVSFTDENGSLRASFSETLFDDITSRNVKSILASGEVGSSPLIRGKIRSTDGKYVFSCDETCGVLRTVTSSGNDIIETIILSNDAGNGLSINRSLLYPNMITVMLDMAFFGSTDSDGGYPAFDAHSVGFNDETSEIKFEGLRLKEYSGDGSVVLNGKLYAFAH